MKEVKCVDQDFVEVLHCSDAGIEVSPRSEIHWAAKRGFFTWGEHGFLVFGKGIVL